MLSVVLAIESFLRKVEGEREGEEENKGKRKRKGRLFPSSLHEVSKSDCEQSRESLEKQKESRNSFMLFWEQKGWFRTPLKQGAGRMVLFRPHQPW